MASYIGAATIREHVVGLDNRRATAGRSWRRCAPSSARRCAAGALGIGSSLIYAPGTYASTEELIELVKAAAPYGGRYISHMRSEGDRLLEAVDELIRIAREAGVPAEIYHLKAAGAANWPKMDQAIARVEAARREGLTITADMYTYTAGATGFDACIPPWSREGGHEALFKRIADPATRARIDRGDARARRWAGRTSAGPRARRERPAPRRVQERGAQAAHRQAARRGGEERGAPTPRTRSSTSSPRTARAWASSSS